MAYEKDKMRLPCGVVCVYIYIFIAAFGPDTIKTIYFRNRNKFRYERGIR